MIHSAVLKGNSTGGTPGNSLVVSSAGSSLRQVNVTIDPAALPGAVTCLQLFDASAVPANGTAPTWRWHLPNAGGTYIFDLPGYESMPNGCTLALSTTFTTLTLAVGAAIHIHSLYEEDAF